MNLLAALKMIQEIGIPIMNTGDIAYKLGVSNAHASQILRRLEKEKHIVHLSRSLWLIDLQINPLVIPDYLTAPFPCYISLQTALYHHGMIDQIPRVVTVVSLARTRRIATPLLSVSVHHIIPEFFFDYDLDPKTQVKMATPEKALLDICYLQPAKSLWFKTLPEIEIPKSFNTKKALDMIQMIPFRSRRSLVEKAFRTFLNKSLA